MILPPVVRVFFAIALPEDINKKIEQYIGELKKLSKNSKIRWTRPENLHITLQFLAEVKTGDVSVLLSNVESALSNAVVPLHFNLRGLHLFPDPHRPRVLVVDVAPQALLAEWSALVGKGIQETGYEIEARPFRAHLSIGRIKTAQSTALNFLQDAAPLNLPDISVGEVVLFQSEPHPEGSHYIPLARLTPGHHLKSHLAL